MLVSSTLSGCQSKFMLNGYIYKEDKKGYESISEALVSELEYHIKGFNFLDYELEKVNGVCCCKSRCMLKDGEKLVSLHDILVSSLGDDSYLEKYSGKDLLKFVLDVVYSVTSLDILGYATVTRK